jgi:hypothetical protein
MEITPINYSKQTLLPYQRCDICNKSVQQRNFAQHLRGVGHIKKAEALSVSNIELVPDQAVPIKVPPANIIPIVYDAELTQKVLSKNIYTQKSLPKSVRRIVAIAIGALYKSCNSSTQDIKAHTQMLIFSKVILASMTVTESQKISRKKRMNSQFKYTQKRLEQ